MNWLLLNSFFAASQSGSSPSNTHTASITVCTATGGFAKDFTSVMSFLSRLSSAFRAFSSAGMATSRSRCASAWTSATASARTFTTLSSASTFARTLAASAWSTASCLMSSSVSLVFCTSTGCRRVSSSCRPSTLALVSFSFSTPTTNRLPAALSLARCSSSMDRYKLMRSRYDLGVVYTFRRSSWKNRSLKSFSEWCTNAQHSTSDVRTSSDGSSSFAKKRDATDTRASRGHSSYQSMVQQLIRDGNMRHRVRSASPTGLMASTTCR